MKKKSATQTQAAAILKFFAYPPAKAKKWDAESKVKWLVLELKKAERRGAARAKKARVRPLFPGSGIGGQNGYQGYQARHDSAETFAADQNTYEGHPNMWNWYNRG